MGTTTLGSWVLGMEPRALCMPGEHSINRSPAPAWNQHFLSFLHGFKLGHHTWSPEALMGTMVGLAAKWMIESGLHHRQLLFIPSFWVICTHSRLLLPLADRCCIPRGQHQALLELWEADQT